MFEFGVIAVSFERLPEFDLAYLDNQGYTALGELMRAIILRTIEDLNCEGEVRDDALAYLYADDSDGDDDSNDNYDYIFSFASICNHLGLNPEKTRQAIVHSEHKISTRRRSI